MENKSLQERLFELLKDQQESSKLTNDLMDLLELSRASVYKRINGEIDISASELEKIIEHFNVNPTYLFSNRENMVTLFLPEKATGNDPILHFLRPISKQIQRLADEEDSLLTFLAVSFPIFYTFLYPELAIFKFYVYRNSVWQPAHAKIPPLAIANMSRNKEYMNLFAEIRNAFGKIKSIEIWRSDFFQSTINELKFYLDCNLFTEPKEALAVMDALEKTIENISTMVSTGNKSTMCRHPENEDGAELDLYYNDSGHFGSTIISETSKINMVYLTYDQPNYLTSADPLLFEDTKEWTSNVIHKSSPISGLSALDQVKFFNEIRSKIKEEREVLERSINK